ncbi:hypothetical protein HPB47_009201 [Ixodes persulcatus]|uniref:Uncharacterized protein n=1 Tax=Ixodes persulcatus TaxID=34615 RepID=A0AC60P2Q8_IXOPE|nr:hypothetical protein HPB47_009201 [Ixodes persulcatus]
MSTPTWSVGRETLDARHLAAMERSPTMQCRVTWAGPLLRLGRRQARSRMTDAFGLWLDAKRLYQLQHKYGFFSEPVDAKRVRDYETQQWLQDAQTKSTLGVYLANKKTIASEVRLYDNSLGSRFLFETPDAVL